MFKNKYSKWRPLGKFTWATERNYIVFVRKNLKTGMMQFKTKWINKTFLGMYTSSMPQSDIDTQKAWDEITTLKQ
tara:strand:+ start:667 stop:891 length:225 start_codon:yes stop_codon:yes gene_type:complete